MVVHIMLIIIHVQQPGNDLNPYLQGECSVTVETDKNTDDTELLYFLFFKFVN